MSFVRFLFILITALVFPALRVESAPVKSAEYFSVKRVIDGDTIELSDSRRVRLIGIDTPEVHFSKKLLKDARKSKKDILAIRKLGAKAASFSRDLCLNKKVRLEYDVEKKDKYNRDLAYVYLEDGTFVNARIIEEGYGQVMTVPPNVKSADLFLKLQRTARENNRGLWKE